MNIDSTALRNDGQNEFQIAAHVAVGLRPRQKNFARTASFRALNVQLPCGRFRFERLPLRLLAFAFAATIAERFAQLQQLLFGLRAHDECALLRIVNERCERRRCERHFAAVRAVFAAIAEIVARAQVSDVAGLPDAAFQLQQTQIASVVVKVSYSAQRCC